MLLGVTGESDLANYDGVVGRIGEDSAARAAKYNLPVVNHWLHMAVEGMPSIFIDQAEASRLAGEHLLLNGYRRLATINVRHTPISNEMTLKGLHQAVEAQGYAEPVQVMIPYEEGKAEWLIEMRQILVEWLKTIEPPIGIFIREWYLARYFIQICKDLGLRVPEDVGIVTGESNTQIVSSGSPTLSGIDFDFNQMGYEAAELLDHILQGKVIDPLVRLIPPKRLIVGDSSNVFVSPDPLVANAMRYIADHCRQTLTVEHLAEAIGTSRRTLYRRFDEVIGRSVNEEIVRLRIEHLKRLLVESDHALAVIAKNNGFSSPSHFTHFFRRETGMTPSAFRKKAREQS